MRILVALILSFSVIFFYGCKIDNSHKKDTHEHHNHDEHDHDDHDHGDHDHDEHDHGDHDGHDHGDDHKGHDHSNIKIAELTGSPAFGDAKLSFGNVKSGDILKSGKVKFEMNVENFELGGQTSDAEGKGLANSGMGQHIHFIINNQPYMAHYGSTFEIDLEPGYYVALAFLSRSYHESVKAEGAFAVIDFVVDKADKKNVIPDLTIPHMFYSRPKGTYKGEDAEKVMLDFFLTNVELSPEGYNVIATINGKKEVITKWAPYVMEGLDNGKNTINLKLVDGSGNMVASPFNNVTRTITLEK